MRSSQDRSYLATDCDGHSFPCEAPGILALMNSEAWTTYCSPLLTALTSNLSEKGDFLIGAPIMNRHYAATKNTVGRKTDIIGWLAF